jgi:glucokinase
MYRIGIDLGGTNIAAAIVNNEFKIVKKMSVPTGAEREASLIMDDMAALCKNVCDEAGIALSEIEAIGIASPGVCNHTDGIVEYSCNLPFRKFHICAELSARLGLDNIHVENDANAAAWGEAVAGAARGTKNSVMITLGTGVGGGVIIDGNVFSGSNYAGTELGHIVIEVGGRPCGCGRRGCWESYSSATGLINMTKEKLAECEASGRKTAMTEIAEKCGKVTGRVAFDGYRAGDAAAKEVVDTYINYLASGLASMINIFQPEVLSIGGGISGEGQFLIDLLYPIVDSERYGGDFVSHKTEIRIAELGNDAGIVGAAFLGI